MRVGVCVRVRVKGRVRERVSVCVRVRVGVRVRVRVRGTETERVCVRERDGEERWAANTPGALSACALTHRGTWWVVSTMGRSTSIDPAAT